MAALTNLTQLARSPGDPEIRRKGPGSLTGADRLARSLGWFSLALGAAELIAPGPIARALGLEGKEGLIRTCGAREIAAAVPTLSVDSSVGLAARVLGDGMDLAILSTALGRDNPKRRNAAIATAFVLGVTALDVIATQQVLATHRRPAQTRSYADRSGFPKGSQAARGLARKDFAIPDDMQAESSVARTLQPA